MNEYMFYTFEGFTQSPNKNECENLQILGFEKAENLRTAKKHLLENNDWILKYGFDKEKILSKRILTEENKKTSDFYSIKDKISFLFKKHYSKDKDPRIILKSVLLEIGLEEKKSSLVSIEAGGSQCKVTREYLKNISVPENIFEEVIAAVKYFYYEFE